MAYRRNIFHESISKKVHIKHPSKDIPACMAFMVTCKSAKNHKCKQARQKRQGGMAPLPDAVQTSTGANNQGRKD
eukprot:1157998-Pelagomonas_calceolata.AAC.6